MTVDARIWLHKLQVISLGRDNRSRNVDAIMTIEYFVEGIHHVVLASVPARYVRQSQLCPQLDVSDTNDKKAQDMSDRARCVRQK